VTTVHKRAMMSVRNMPDTRAESWLLGRHKACDLPSTDRRWPAERSGRRQRGSPIRVRYAVQCMVVLRCTQRLLLRLKQFDDETSARSTTRLGDWYGNVLHMGQRHVLIFISERSRLPILIPIREANRLAAAFRRGVSDARRRRCPSC